MTLAGGARLRELIALFRKFKPWNPETDDAMKVPTSYLQCAGCGRYNYEPHQPECLLGCALELAELTEQALEDAAALLVPPRITGETSDGYHTFDELYDYRKAYNALLFNEWAEQGRYDVHKAWKHSDGEPCFGGGWFVVVAQTPAGQVSNHYKSEDWDLFRVPERERGAEWDGHTPQMALERLFQSASLLPSSSPAPQELQLCDACGRELEAETRPDVCPSQKEFTGGTQRCIQPYGHTGAHTSGSASWQSRTALPASSSPAPQEREIEAAFKAGYHCQWIRSERRYVFDPELTPGDPDGAYAAWKERQDQER